MLPRARRASRRHEPGQDDPPPFSPAFPGEGDPDRRGERPVRRVGVRRRAVPTRRAALQVSLHDLPGPGGARTVEIAAQAVVGDAGRGFTAPVHGATPAAAFARRVLFGPSPTGVAGLRRNSGDPHLGHGDSPIGRRW